MDITGEQMLASALEERERLEADQGRWERRLAVFGPRGCAAAAQEAQEALDGLLEALDANTALLRVLVRP